MYSEPLLGRDENELIMRILKKGNTVELKKEQGKLVIVEIDRKVKSKTSITG